jgi:hypothetical protein
MEGLKMASITISGHKFEVPEGVLARYELGYQLQTEGEVAAIRQTLAENLRNNFAGTVKAAGNGELTEEQVAELQAKFNEYAATYQFGVRKAGSGAPRAPKDPVEREMQKLAKDAVSKAFYAKHGEKIDKEQLAELSPSCSKPSTTSTRSGRGPLSASASGRVRRTWRRSGFNRGWAGLHRANSIVAALANLPWTPNYRRACPPTPRDVRSGPSSPDERRPVSNLMEG